SRRRHTRFSRDWSSDVCSSDLALPTRQISGDLTAVESATPLFAVAGFRAICPFGPAETLLPPQSQSPDAFGAEHGLEAPRRRLRSEERRVGRESGTQCASQHVA